MTTPTQQDRKMALAWLALRDNPEQALAEAIAAERTRVIEELRAWWNAALERTRTPSTWTPGQTVVDYGQAALGLATQLDAMAAQEPKEG